MNGGSESATTSTGSPTVATFGVLGCGAYLTCAMWAMDRTTYDVWSSLLLVPLLLAISAPILLRTARRDGESGLAQLLMLALLLKLLSAVARYYTAFVMYGGVADSETYHLAGMQLAELLRLGYFEQPDGPFPGTAMISIVTGVVYAVFGSAKLTGFFVFSWLGFWGLFLFFRAFRIAVPGGDARRYSVLVLFLPSLLFWPSSIGKEAWMTFTLGLCAYGAARLLSRHPGGVPALTLGLAGAALVRPHMAALVFAALFAAYIIRPSSRASILSPLGKLAMILVLVATGLVLLKQTERFFGVGETSSTSFSDVIDRTNTQTAQGGSSYDAARVRSPADLPAAVLTVLFRPFPHEADNAQALVASVEGLMLLCLVGASHRRLRTLPRQLRHNPFVVFATAYTLMFIIVFSSFANFGILTRQRVQVYPFVLLLLALPKALPRPRRELLVPAGGLSPLRKEPA